MIAHEIEQENQRDWATAHVRVMCQRNSGRGADGRVSVRMREKVIDRMNVPHEASRALLQIVLQYVAVCSCAAVRSAGSNDTTQFCKPNAVGWRKDTRDDTGRLILHLLLFPTHDYRAHHTNESLPA